MRYSQVLLNYFHNRIHGGQIAAGSEHLRVSQVGHEDQEVLVLYILFEKTVLTARFKAFGSVELIAAGEFICTWLENKDEMAIRNLSTEMILTGLGLGSLKIHIANLVLQAVQQLFT